MNQFLTSKDEIKIWLDSMNIQNYDIHDDLTVDVNNQVYLYNKGLTHLPVQFGIVEKNFDISNNELTSLVGSPHTANALFRCKNNFLTDLVGGPHEAFDFNVNYNKITTLKGAPEIVHCFFSCAHNELTSLDYLPKKIGHTLDLSKNPISSLKGLEKCDLQMGLVLIDCLLTHLDEVPLHINKLCINGNPIINYSNLFNLTELSSLMMKDYLNKEDLVYFSDNLISQKEIKEYLSKLKIQDEKEQLGNLVSELPKQIKRLKM
jgi:hypothetical protein